MTLFLTDGIVFGKTIALLAFGTAGLTDYLDGYLARRGYGVTLFGKLMDPVADKVLVCAAFISFVSIGRIVPAWIVIIIITREFMVTGLRLLAVCKGKMMSAGAWGKHKTAWQIVVIVIIILGLAIREDWIPLVVADAGRREAILAVYNHAFRYVTFWISFAVAVLTVVSGGIYYWRERKILLDGVTNPIES